MKVLALIPARFASTRFPGKPMAILGKKTMIQRVCEQVAKATAVDQLAVVTDDERIFRHIQSIGYQAFNSSPDHQSGTDRCAETAAQMTDFDLIVNVQGDEPFVRPEQIDLLVSFLKNSELEIATLVKRLTEPEKIINPNIVKAVFSKKGKALYFSRSPIPYLRGSQSTNQDGKGIFYKHIGMYAFRRKTLLAVSKLAPSPLEKAESLEQLRWLENDFSIGVVETEQETIGIDTPEDLARAELYLKSIK